MSTPSSLRFSAQTDVAISLITIVNLVRRADARTKPELGKMTGLGRGVVTQRVDQAIALGYLEESEFGPSVGGRAPRTLRFRAEQGLILVCALGGLHLRIGVTDLDGRILARAHKAWDITAGPDDTIAMAMAMFEEVLDSVPAAPVWGVGVGIPGPVAFESGRPVAPPIMPGWNGFDIKGRFAERFQAPVWVDNDVNLLTLSERTRRPGPGQDDLIYYKVGSGIGAGLLSKGILHRGANGAAGDIGHVRMHGSAVLCRCGKVGCLEAGAAGWAIVRDAKSAARRGESPALAALLERNGDLLPLDVAVAAQRGDAVSIVLVQRAAQLVGESIATLVNVFNPAVIVVGGALTAAGEIFLAEIRQRVYDLSLPMATHDLVLVHSVKDEDDPLRGGSEMVREQLFDVSFNRWFAQGRPVLSTLQRAG